MEAFYHLGQLLKVGLEEKQAVGSAAKVVLSARHGLALLLCRLLTWSIVTVLSCRWLLLERDEINECGGDFLPSLISRAICFTQIWCLLQLCEPGQIQSGLLHSPLEASSPL